MSRLFVSLSDEATNPHFQGFTCCYKCAPGNLKTCFGLLFDFFLKNSAVERSNESSPHTVPFSPQKQPQTSYLLPHPHTLILTSPYQDG